MQITYTKQEHFDFARELSQSFIKAQIKVQVYSERQTIEINNVILGHLLQRIEEQHTIVIPNFDANRWLIAGATLQQLETTRTHIQHFLVPTYAQFEKNSLPKLQSFRSDSRQPVQRLGAVIYPAGYYVLESKSEYVETILKKLALWMKLESERPRTEREPLFTYGILYERFKTALASGQWQEAESVRTKIQQLNLTGADNLIFLEIEQLAHQQRWSKIALREDFAYLARMQVTREVRSALLTAFHQTTLLPLQQEEKWLDALEKFRETLPMLGLLLTGRLGITQGPVVQMYAYQAALEQDRGALTALATINKSQETLECITQLLLLLGPEEPKVVEQTPVIRSPLNLVREALGYGNYDTATQYAQEIDDPGEQAVLLMQIAFLTYDASMAEQALLAYWDRPIEEQEQLQKLFPFVRMILDPLQKLVNNTTVTQNDVDITLNQEHSIHDWLEWFSVVKTQPDNPALPPLLKRLDTVIDDRFWTLDKVEQLNDNLLTIVTEPQIMRYFHVRDALKRLANFFLNDEEFPRQDNEYTQLYETLYTGLLEAKADQEQPLTGFVLLRLADALLRQAPGRCNNIYKHLEQWCPNPIPKLESWILEVFDLLAEYGLAAGLLTLWYRAWVSSLLDLPGTRDRLNLETWLEFGKWIHPGIDIIQRLQETLIEAGKDEESPVSALPNGYQIGIYCLRQSTAKQARELLLLRNHRLDVRLCFDEVLTKQAQAIAENSDMAVIVTTCMTHALTYGITPYLKKACVYPPSSGSTSIVRSIEEYARQMSK